MDDTCKPEEIMIMNIRVQRLNGEQLLQRAKLAVDNKAGAFFTYVNAHCMNIASKDESYREILNATDVVYADGIGVVWAAKKLYGVELIKLTGREWMGAFCAAAATEGWRVYLLGGKPGVAKRAGEKIIKDHPRLQIAGSSDGYFLEKSEEAVFEEIAQAGVDVVFIGMGVPKQEYWFWRNRWKIKASLCWAVGALFDVLSGEEKIVPEVFNRWNLEWLWRFLQNPGGKWKRYLAGTPEFIWRVWKEANRRKGVT